MKEVSPARGRTLSADSRVRLQQILRELNITQKELAYRTGVSTAWLSNFLNGTRPTDNPEGAAKVFETLRQLTREHHQQTPATDEALSLALAALTHIQEEYGRYLPAVTEYIERVDVAGEILPPDSPVLVDRMMVLDSQALPLHKAIDLQLKRRPFTASLTGPPQCGKTTILTSLYIKARGQGLAVAAVDCSLLSPTEPERNGTPNGVDWLHYEAQEYERLNAFLIAQLCYQWDLPEPSDGRDFIPWLQALLVATSTVHRLIIVEKATSLSMIHLHRVMQIISAITGIRAKQHIPVSICIELPLDSHRIYLATHGVSSARNYQPKFTVGWFTFHEVRDLVQRIAGHRLAPTARTIYQQYGGQPVLSHHVASHLNSMADDPAIILDTLFARALSGVGLFGDHITVVRHLLFTRDGQQEAPFRVLRRVMQTDCTEASLAADIGYQYLRDVHLVVTDRQGYVRVASQYYKRLLQSMLDAE